MATFAPPPPLDTDAGLKRPSHIRKWQASQYRTELAREPPSTSTGRQLTPDEIHARSEALAKYTAAAQRPWRIKPWRATPVAGGLRVRKLHKLARSVRARPAAEPTGHDDLYIMQNSRIPGEFKVGRSKDVTARQKDLQGSQNFHMIVHAVYPGAGHLEKRVHELLAPYRRDGFPGTEWFNATLRQVGKAVMTAKQEQLDE